MCIRDRNTVESRRPPALETAEPLGERHLLERTRSRTDLPEPGKDLCGPIHIECLRHVPGRWNGLHSPQAVALRRLCGYAAPVSRFGMSDTWSPDPAPRLCAASLHKQRVRGGTVPGAECQNTSVCRAGRDGYRRALAKNPKALICQGFRAKNDPGRLNSQPVQPVLYPVWVPERRAERGSNH